MTVETIDVVVKSSGTRRVVRDLNEIGNAADSAGGRLSRLQRQLDALNTNRFTQQLRNVQQNIAGLGQNQALSQFQAQLNAVTTALGQMNQQLNQTGGAMNRHLGGGGGGATGPLAYLRHLRSAILGVMTVLGVKQILQWADEWTVSAGKILIFSKNAAQANVVMQEIYRIAQEVRSPLQSLAQLYTRLAISSRELGVSQREMLSFTGLVGKIFAIQGTGMMQARGALLQLSQAMGEGIVRGQEFNSLLENAPLLLTIVAKHLKGAEGSVAQLRRIMLKGNLTSKDFFEALMKGQKEVEEMFKNAPKTFGQAFIVLVNGIEKYLGELNMAYGLSTKFFTLTSFIATNMETIAKVAVLAGIALAAAFAPALLGAAAAGIGAIAAGIGTVAAVLYANPFVALVAGAAAAVLFADSIKIGVDNVTTLADVFEVIGPEIKGFFKDRFTELVTFLSGSSDLMATMLKDVDFSIAGVVRFAAAGMDLIAGLITGLGVGLIRVFEGLPTAMDQVGKMMFNAIVGSIEDIINAAITGVNKLWSLIGKGALDAVKFERANVDTKFFEQYGQSIMGSLDRGFEIQGNFMLNKVNSIFAKAADIAKTRSHEAFRASERLAASLDEKMGASGKTSKADPKGAAKAARERMNALKTQISEMLDSYRARAAEQAEIERHKEVMLKQQYDQGLVNYREYHDKLAALQKESFTRQENDLMAQKTMVQSKMEELRTAMKRAGKSDPAVENAIQDLTTKLKGLDTQLTRLRNQNTERLGEDLTRALAPGRQFVQNMEKVLAVEENNTEQALRQIEAKSELVTLSEKQLFIQTEMNKLTNKYEDQLAKTVASLEQLVKNGVFDDLSNPATMKLLGDYQAIVLAIQKHLAEIKEKAPEALARAFDASQALKFSNELKDAISNALLEGGKEGGSSLREALKNILKKPIKVVLDGVLQPITNAISNAMMPVLNSFAGMLSNVMSGGGTVASQAGGGIGSSLLSAGSMVGSMFGTGGLTGSLMAGAGWMTGATTFTGALSAGASLIGTGTAAGFMSGAGMIAGALGPIALGVAALYSLFSGDKGGPKVGAYAGVSALSGSNAVGMQDVQNEEFTRAVTQSVNSLNTSFSTLVRQLGGSGVARFGVGISTDPEGTSPSFAEVTARDAAGNPIYANVDTNIGRSQEALTKRLAEMTTEALIAALRGSGVEQAYLTYFDKISAGMDAEGKQAALETIGQLGNFSQLLKQLGPTFSQLSNLSVDAKANLMELSGGFDALVSSLNTYYDNFFTEEEKRANTIRNMTQSLNSIGMNMTEQGLSDVLNGPNAKAVFRDWVNYYMAIGTGGEKALSVLLQISGAFASMIPVAEELAETVNSVIDDKAVADLRSAITKRYNEERTALESLQGKMKSFIETFTNFKNSLNQGSLSPLTPEQKYTSARAELDKVVGQIAAGGGDAIVAAERYTGVAQAFLEASQVYNASNSQYVTDFNMVQAQLATGIGMAQKEYDAATQQLRHLEYQTRYLMEIGTDTRTMVQLMDAAMNTPGIAANPEGVVTQLYHALVGRSPDPAGLQYWSQKLTAGETVSSLIQQAMQLPEVRSYLGLPGHAGGLSSVPYDNYVFRAHQGEAILTRSQAAMWRSGGGAMDLSPLIARLNMVIDEVAELRNDYVSGVNAEIATMRQTSQENAEQVAAGVGAATNRSDWMRKQRTDAVLE
jgi:tape measure domain-containing protein